jgi:hypothetical protein
MNHPVATYKGTEAIVGQTFKSDRKVVWEEITLQKE